RPDSSEGWVTRVSGPTRVFGVVWLSPARSQGAGLSFVVTGCDPNIGTGMLRRSAHRRAPPSPTRGQPTMRARPTPDALDSAFEARKAFNVGSELPVNDSESTSRP